ncbi:MAG TPA: SIS domain-containing protein [Terriglobia bacterium]|nr:SIS domain-containing protein [Terriglobia bacterium]
MTPKQNGYRDYLDGLKTVMDQLPIDNALRAAEILFRAYQSDHTVFLFGNGGSAALASHMAADLGKCTHFPGPEWIAPVKRLKALSVTDNMPLLTAWANDTSYDKVFAAQIENFVQKDDVAFAISGSGNSPNVIRALELARRKEAITIGLMGCGGGKMSELVDCAILVPCYNMQQVEDCHVIVSHMVFLDLKKRIESEAKARLHPETVCAGADSEP